MKKNTAVRLLSTAFLTLVVASQALAQYAKPNTAEEKVMSSDAFLSSHPDLRYRLLGLKAYQSADYAKALAHFKRAAKFADKPSQGMVAEMLWSGQGGPVDRPLAHAWMDLAAERKFEVMVVQRDRFWRKLTEAERAQALTLVKPLFAEYADKVAQPRLERLLRNERRTTTGSRTGFTSNLMITLPGPAGDVKVHGHEFYQDKFWKPEAYWAWHEEDWKELPKGRVDVGPLQVPASN